MTIKDLLKESHETAISKGWWGLPVKNGGVQERNFGELIALAHSELSEALEEVRIGSPLTEIYHDLDKPVGVPVELADLFIRIADMCEHYGIPLERALKEKMAYNKTRSHRHGGKTC
jgi:NTP pyrophosphatase (non-canonical NTP hydrolase)